MRIETLQTRAFTPNKCIKDVSYDEFIKPVEVLRQGQAQYQVVGVVRIGGHEKHDLEYTLMGERTGDLYLNWGQQRLKKEEVEAKVKEIGTCGEPGELLPLCRTDKIEKADLFFAPVEEKFLENWPQVVSESRKGGRSFIVKAGSATSVLVFAKSEKIKSLLTVRAPLSKCVCWRWGEGVFDQGNALNYEEEPSVSVTDLPIIVRFPHTEKADDPAERIEKVSYKFDVLTHDRRDCSAEK